MFKKAILIILLIASLVIILTPFFVISNYNQPSGDDYDWLQGIRSRGFAEQTSWYYQQWTGRYALTSYYIFLNPLIYSDGWWAYQLFPIILMILLALAIFLLLKSLFRNFQNYKLILFSLIILAFYLATLPSVSQGLYWFSSSSNYLLASILGIITLALLFFLKNSTKKLSQIILATLIILGIILSCGANEITLLAVVAGLFLLTLHAFYKKTRQKYLFLTFWLISLICLIISFSAPGNWNRLEQESNQQGLISTLYHSLTGTFSFVNTSLSLGLVLLTIIWLSLYLLASKKEKSFKFNFHPVLALIITLGLIYLSYLISLATAGSVTGRMTNIIYLIFIMGWLTLVASIFERINKKTTLNFQGSTNFWLIISLLLALTLILTPNLTTIYKDLTSGEAKKYDQQITRRYQEIANTPNKTNTVVIVEKLTAQPETLFYTDLADENNWRNVTAAYYFQIKGIKYYK